MNSPLKSMGILLLGCLILLPSLSTQAGPSLPGIFKEITQGALRVEQEDGTIVECPLQHTDVQADISGFITRVRVTQTFFNPFEEPIEAVYVFPLPHNSAVDEMTMFIGKRRIVGKIDRREEARRIYEQALAQGQTAALLEQERPNIFTQSVGNIEPGQTVKIEIAYVDVLEYDMGVYEFHFPMVVGPRYNATAPFPGTDGGPKPDPTTLIGEGPTTKPHGVNPSVLKPGYRTGHDISLSVRLEAGVPIRDITTPTHQTSIDKTGNTGAEIVLSSADSIPNKDFVLRYAVAGEKPEMAVLSHKPSSREDGYFMLMIQPRLDEEMKKTPPREIVFLIDISGSMSGQPTEKVKESMRHFFKRLNSRDTVQVITFAGQANKLFPAPVKVTEDNVQKALAFTDSRQAGGGTRMLDGIKMVLSEPADPERVRICVMLTDGYIGNEAEIIKEVGEKAGDRIRFWAVGVGSSINRFLIDGVAKQGGGMAKVLTLDEDSEPLVEEIAERIHRAQLADISINWGSLDVYQTYPTRIPELWAGRPVVVFGRYGDGGRETLLIDGMAEGQPLSYTLDVEFPRRQRDHQSLSKVWARKKVKDLMQAVYMDNDPAVVEEITQIALEYSLMSQFTSFVAVDDSKAPDYNETRKPPRRVDIPVPLPKGVQYQGIFGDRSITAYGAFEDSSVEYFAHEGTVSMGDIVRTKAMVQTAMPGRSSNYAAWSAGIAQTGSLAGLGAGQAGTARRLARTGRGVPLSSQISTSDAWTAHPSSSVPAYKSLGYVSSSFERTDETRVLYERAKVLDEIAIGSHLEWTLQQEGADLKTVNNLIEDATTAFKAGALLKARGLAQLAWLLAISSNQARQAGPEATSLLQEINEKWFEEKVNTVPALEEKLDRIIRNQALSKALEQLSKDLDLEIRLDPEAAEDAKQLLGQEQLRLHYYDLQKMKAADALDWILSDFHLVWTPVNEKEIRVTSSRQLPGSHPWVYDVAATALPDVEELGEDHQQRQENFRKAAQDYVKAFRLALNLPEDSTALQMIGAGRLMIYGDANTQHKVKSIIRYLQNSGIGMDSLKFELSKEAKSALTELQKKTSARYARRIEDIRNTEKIQAHNESLARLNHFGWQLLAASAKGQVDLEALTEIQVALEKLQPEAKPETRIIPRAVWILTEAAKSLDHKELSGYAKKVLTPEVEKLPSVIKALKDQPENQELLLGLTYSTLALKNGIDAGWLKEKDTAQLTNEAVSLIRRERTGLFLRDLRLSGMVLVSDTVNPEMAGLLKDRIPDLHPDADQLVLSALAARRVGEDTWKAFREYISSDMGRMQLPGSVVVFIHDLDQTHRIVAQGE
jgi:Ca-activated chloride channel homolog